MKHKFNFLAMALLSLLFTITSCEKEPGTEPIPSNPLVVTDVDGNNYNVIILNDQMWLKENLRTTKLTNGIAISEVKIASDWMGSSTPAYCKV